jgi:hypothetical protein
MRLPIQGRQVQFLALVAVAVFVSGEANADPILIAAGRMVIPQNQEATVHVEGARGFTLDAFNPFMPPATDANWMCSGSPDPICLPGARIPLNTGSSGSDLNAIVTLDGETFTSGISPDQGVAGIQFNSSFVVPDFTADQVTVFTPFTFSGLVMPPLGQISTPLVGSGTVRLDLAQINTTGGPRWTFQQAQYDFQTPAAVPEPATLVLVGSGIAGYLLRRKQRPHAASERNGRCSTGMASARMLGGGPLAPGRRRSVPFSG